MQAALRGVAGDQFAGVAARAVEDPVWHEELELPGCGRGPWVPMTRTGQVEVALLVCLARGLLGHGDRVVCLTGLDGSNVMDTVMVLDLGSEPELFALSDAVPLGEDVSPEVFERTLTLATELA